MKKLTYTILFSIFWISFFFSCPNFSYAREGNQNIDLLDQAFQPAVESSTVFGWDETLGPKGSYLLKGRTEFTINSKEKGFKKQTSLLVQVTQFLLTMTIILAVPVLIYNGIQYMIKSSKGENPKEIITNLIWIAGGILLALLSVMIVKFASSLGPTTIGIQ